MNHHQVEMGDTGLYQVLVFGRWIVKAGHELIDEGRHLVGVWPLVHGLAGFLLADIDVSQPPATRPILQVIAGHHEVQALDELRAVREVFIGR
jgi:hypothetical protein